MSATGRGPRLGGPEDFFKTPAWCIDRLLDRLELPDGIWLEPSAGDGAIIETVNRRMKPKMWHAMDVREECFAPLEKLLVGENDDVVIGDFLTDPFLLAPNPAVVITNPPYNLAAEFLIKCRERFPQALIIFLLRLNFLGSQKRQPLLSTWTPDVFVLPKRPAFVNGRTDSIEYAWMVWMGAAARDAGTIEILDL